MIMPMHFDMTYVYLVLPALAFALIAGAMVKSTFAKYSRQMSSRRITGAEAAERILRANGLYNVRIERVSGSLTDHYDPKSNTIRLSQSVYSETSTAAIGVAAHEAGHAIQYAENYAPIKVRAAIVPATQVGSKLAIPLILIGIILAGMSETFIGFAYAGLLCFTLSVFFQLVTLPVEFNASRRAMAAIEKSAILSGDELTGARRVLSAAAMTYVAALAVSLAQLLRFMAMLGRRR